MFEVEPLRPKIYINSFPKSGTHLAILITAHLAKRQEPKYWLGSFRLNSWSKIWGPPPHVKRVIDGQPPGTWMMGHCGYLPYYERAFDDNNTCVLFIYRDLRDVAVSITYHIENPDTESFKHPGRDEYLALPTHEDRLRAVIEGLGEWPGVIERWDLYKGWLSAPGVLSIKYEDMREDPGSVAAKVLDYVVIRTLGKASAPPAVMSDNFSDAIKYAIDKMGTTEYSGSYRRGKIGGWREEFTPEIEDLFNKLAGDRLERLGYNAERDQALLQQN